MERVYLDSSELNWVHYNEHTLVLRAEFKKGDVYRYFGVPLHIYAGLISADSHGRYFNEYVRNAGYDYEKEN
jgi:hypothetical protein